MALSAPLRIRLSAHRCRIAQGTRLRRTTHTQHDCTTHPTHERKRCLCFDFDYSILLIAYTRTHAQTHTLHPPEYLTLHLHLHLHPPLIPPLLPPLHPSLHHHPATHRTLQTCLTRSTSSPKSPPSQVMHIKSLPRSPPSSPRRAPSPVASATFYIVLSIIPISFASTRRGRTKPLSPPIKTPLTFIPSTP